MNGRKLSKTETMWMARLAKGSSAQQYTDKAVDRLIGRGLVAVIGYTGKANMRTRIVAAVA